MPILIIGLVSALLTFAMLPLAETEWAEGIRTAFRAADQERERPGRIFLMVAPLLKVAVFMGVPALITLAVLRLGKD